jgi:hypothetical protein
MLEVRKHTDATEAKVGRTMVWWEGMARFTIGFDEDGAGTTDKVT